MAYYNNNYWDYSGASDYLAQADEDEDYIAHYGVKGMRWGKHAYTSVSPDGVYTYGIQNNKFKGVTGTHETNYTGGGIGGKRQVASRSANNTVNYSTRNDRVLSVNPNAKKFGISIKNGQQTTFDKAKTTSSYSRNDKNGRWHTTYKPSAERITGTSTSRDRYLQINYDKNTLNKAKNKVTRAGNIVKGKTAHTAKKLINTIRGNRATDQMPGNASRIKSKNAVNKYYQGVKDRVAVQNKVYENQKRAESNIRSQQEHQRHVQANNSYQRSKHPIQSYAKDQINHLKNKIRIARNKRR